MLSEEGGAELGRELSQQNSIHEPGSGESRIYILYIYIYYIYIYIYIYNIYIYKYVSCAWLVWVWVMCRLKRSAHTYEQLRDQLLEWHPIDLSGHCKCYNIGHLIHKYQ